MKNEIFESLLSIGDDLEADGFSKSAETITGIMGGLLAIKEAQYVGMQGYAIRNRRCWDGCYRSKRTTSPNKAAQEVWMECWSEYQDSINDDKSGWEKYASSDVKKVSGGDKKLLAKLVEAKIEKGMTIAEAMYATIEEDEQKIAEHVEAYAKTLLTFASTFNENNLENYGKRIQDVGLEIMKEAQYGKGFFSNLFRGKWTGKSRLTERLQSIQKDIEGMITYLQMNFKHKHPTASLGTQVYNSKIITAAEPEGQAPLTNPNQTMNRGEVGQGFIDSFKQKFINDYRAFRNKLGQERIELDGIASNENPATKSMVDGALQGIDTFLATYGEQWAAGDPFAAAEPLIQALNSLSGQISTAMRGTSIESTDRNQDGRADLITDTESGEVISRDDDFDGTDDSFESGEIIEPGDESPLAQNVDPKSLDNRQLVDLYKAIVKEYKERAGIQEPVVEETTGEGGFQSPEAQQKAQESRAKSTAERKRIREEADAVGFQSSESRLKAQEARARAAAERKKIRDRAK